MNERLLNEAFQEAIIYARFRPITSTMLGQTETFHHHCGYFIAKCLSYDPSSRVRVFSVFDIISTTGTSTVGNTGTLEHLPTCRIDPKSQMCISLLLLLLGVAFETTFAGEGGAAASAIHPQIPHSRIPARSIRNLPKLGSKFVPAYLEDDNFNHDSTSLPRMSIANMTCDYFQQPLNHFVPRGKSPTFPQRYCVYDGFVLAKDKAVLDDEDNEDDDESSSSAAAPIFFYTGNESPLEQYINHTGLMWELAPLFHARVVFAEHRYEGQSLPPANLSQDCMAYGSTIQALADYADLLQLHLNPHSVDTGKNTNMEATRTAPVIVFGGSYGGMLSAWMRMKYPHLVAGAIAASAPIGGFPQTANRKIDGAARILAHGLEQSYPPDKKGNIHTSKKGTPTDNHCGSNLLATWPLITWLVRQNGEDGEYYDDIDDNLATFLQDVFRLCEPYSDTDPEPLLQFATSLWFDLAEGSFPYPSSYIPFALLHKKVNLPAWPLQASCWHSGLHQDWNIVFQGDPDDNKNVHYNITYGDSNIALQIDWENVTLASSPPSPVPVLSASKDIVGLLSSVREAIGIWHNITKNVQCYNVRDVAPNSRLFSTASIGSFPSATTRTKKTSSIERELRISHRNDQATKLTTSRSPAQTCREKIKQVGSWEPVCCNDEMNLVITEAQGLGHDFFWPPSLPRGVNTYSQMMENVTLGPCSDPDGIFGYSKEDYDPWSTWLDTYYGSSRMSGHSNIIFSNGMLDPWAAGGVYAEDPFDSRLDSTSMVQNITESGVIALLIEYGGHHTDLMYSNKLDPECVKKARDIEKKHITDWIREWSSARCSASNP